MNVPEGPTVAGLHIRSIRHDPWKLRALPLDYFATYLDIGANVGFVALHMRILFPRVKIYAIEPDLISYAALASNMDNLFATTERLALGDGRPAICTPGRNSLMHHWCASDDTNGAETCPTMRFADICDHFTIAPARGFVKIDVQGAESVLVGDSRAEAYLAKFKMIGLEFHRGALEIPDYMQWVRECFSKTHEIETLWSSCPDTAGAVRLDRK